ncbi:hypothetical protein [Roseateles chitinivorans]|uniref:hypothetical protein n=1 Tax=Roseateles chitinivorans TaxID=2917965 RepID=UPI003D67EBBF
MAVTGNLELHLVVRRQSREHGLAGHDALTALPVDLDPDGLVGIAVSGQPGLGAVRFHLQVKAQRADRRRAHARLKESVGAGVPPLIDGCFIGRTADDRRRQHLLDGRAIGEPGPRGRFPGDDQAADPDRVAVQADIEPVDGPPGEEESTQDEVAQQLELLVLGGEFPCRVGRGQGGDVKVGRGLAGPGCERPTSGLPLRGRRVDRLQRLLEQLRGGDGCLVPACRTQGGAQGRPIRRLW